MLLILVSFLIFLSSASPALGYTYDFWGYHWQPSHVGLKYDTLRSDLRTAVYNARMAWNNTHAGVYITYDTSSSNQVVADYYGTSANGVK